MILKIVGIIIVGTIILGIIIKLARGSLKK